MAGRKIAFFVLLQIALHDKLVVTADKSGPSGFDLQHASLYGIC
jgi:hypothetical protein